MLRLLLICLFCVARIFAATEPSPAEKPIAPKMEPEEGIYYVYGTGFINVRLQESHISLYFLNKDKAVLKPKFSEVKINIRSNKRVVQNVPAPGTSGPSGSSAKKQMVLTLTPSSDGKGLFAQRVLRPPYKQYTLWATLPDETKLEAQRVP